MKRSLLVWALLVAAACSAPAPLATSLVGEPLYGPDHDAPRARWLQAEIDAARAHWRLAPTEMNAVWVGRRLAYASRYDEAIDWYRGALETFPDSYRLRRHLGHRLLTVRRIDEAVEVLTEARALAADHPNRLEPDGAPGPSGEPRSTTHGNIDYHLALGLYLCGQFDRAAELWGECLRRWARNDDSRVAALHWLHTSLLRAGRADEAARALETPIDPDDVIENFAYHELVRMYRGELALEELAARADAGAALRYGVARTLIARGDVEAGEERLRALVGRSDWPAFGVLAAEADLLETFVTRTFTIFGSTSATE